MRGFPKHLNSKADYEYIKANFPAEQWKPCWQELLDNKYQWFSTGNVAKDGGTTDATHKVVTSKDMDGNDVYTQYEYRENPMCDMNRLGFTEKEINDVLNNA